MARGFDFDTRLQLHWAAQVAAGVGRALLPPKSDDSHTNFEWSSPNSALQQGVVDGEQPFRAAIRFADCAIVLYGLDGAALDEFRVAGRTLDEAFDHMAKRCGELTGRSDVKLVRPPEGMPDHPVAYGARFSPHPDTLRDLVKLYDGADAVLRDVQRTQRNASDVRCWPHHFDIATLITEEMASAGSEARTIGIGMVPGDKQYAEPYWYVTPWPYPRDASVPPLRAGFWNREGWFGAVLLAGGGPSLDQVRAFIDEAVAASREVVAPR